MSQAQQHPTWENASVEEKKNDIAENEYTPERSNVVTITPEEDNAVRRKFNRKVLPTLIWVYFLQIADKYILGLAAVWGLQKDAGLHGTQYSTMASMNAIAQLIWLPFSSYLLVRVPNREYMTVLVVGWGAALMGMGFSHSFGALCATRFLVGLFEAACLPLFAMITAQYWKRSEQTLIVACWYGTNGIATMVCSLMSFGIGHVHSPHIKSWQLVFILPACLTILTGPIVYFTIPNSVADSKFLDEREKEVALERVRLNKTGTGSKEYKASHLKEAAWDPKTYMLIATSVFLNAGANVTGTFGGLLIKGLGFNNFITSLLNMPFGAVQFLVIILFAWLATRFKYKGPFLAAMCIPVIIGTVILFVSGRHKSDNPKNLVGYYLLGFIFAGNPLIVSWAIANTGGSTKKAVVLVIYNIGSSIGNIIGPFLFRSKDSPYYRPGLRLVLILFIALFGVVIAQIFWFTLLNKRNRSRRVALGLPEHLVDHSMMSSSEEKAAGHIDVEEDEDTEDTPDLQNPKFIYVL